MQEILQNGSAARARMFARRFCAWCNLHKKSIEILAILPIAIRSRMCYTIIVERGKGNRVVRVPWRRDPSQSQQNLNLTTWQIGAIMDTSRGGDTDGLGWGDTRQAHGGVGSTWRVARQGKRNQLHKLLT